MLTRVLAAWHAEAELKVKTLEQPLSEVMPLDHSEVLYGQVPHRELHAERGRERERCETGARQRQVVHTADYLSFLRGSNLSQSEESRTELVTDEAASIWVGVPSVACFVR